MVLFKMAMADVAEVFKYILSGVFSLAKYFRLELSIESLKFND